MSRESLDPEPREMTFLEHLEESRKTLIACFLCLALGIGLIASFLHYFADILSYPLQIALDENDPNLQGLTTTGPMGVFSVMLQVCFIGGFFIALPAMLYFAGRFIAPGLTGREKRLLLPASIAALLMFLIGASFSFFFLVPASLKAAMYFNDMLGFETIWRADKYYGLLTWMVLGVGTSFEFPLVILLLVHIGILSTEKLKHWRPYSAVGFLILAAVITPTTDPFTFLLMAVPMMILYEASVIISRRLEKRRDAQGSDPIEEA